MLLKLSLQVLGVDNIGLQSQHIEQIGGDRESQLHHAFVLNEDDS